MAGMAKQLKKRAKKAYSASLCTEVMKTIKRSDVIALNKSMESITRQNAKERTESEKAAMETIWGGRI